MSNKVFIIGNGFDLDLGMNTRYSDFANSDNWPKTHYIGRSLSDHLHRKSHLLKWFDLEAELLVYAQLKDKQQGYLYQYKSAVEPDKAFFDELVKSLTLYIKNEELRELKQDAVAAKVLRAIVSSRLFDSIYSFNYTDLHSIANKMGLKSDFGYEHVHGSVKDNSIILGVDDKSDLLPGYQYLYKTYSPHYESHPILFDLLEADEVVFFGHSLGHNDYHYFKAFFQKQCREGMERKDSKRITLFTYDDSSRIEILEQLRQMNNKNTDLLFNMNQMEVICTNNGGGKRLHQFINRLGEEARVLKDFYNNVF